MFDFEKHIYRCGPRGAKFPSDEALEETQVSKLRKEIEPWLASVFQSEHLSLLLGSGFSIGVTKAAEGSPVSMEKCEWACEDEYKEKVDEYAEENAKICGRGTANFEDQIRAAMQLKRGLEVVGNERANLWESEINFQLKRFLDDILKSERSLLLAEGEKKQKAENLLINFLLSFACRTATRERLNLFTTNYDRFIEYGCDLAGLHVLDRFVGALTPLFRASRLNIDIHYNPPGIRGEPRYMEGVMKLCKVHGSVDWQWDEEKKELRHYAIPFGASPDHPDIPIKPSESTIIYPNPAKGIETLEYPYSELFRDLASAVCRPNSSLITYGYGFGDDHVNRIIKDMITIPSTHLVIIARDETNPDLLDAPDNSSRRRIIDFCCKIGKQAQISLLLGSNFGDLETLVQNYLPKPAIDPITIRKTKLEELRGEEYKNLNGESEDEQFD